MSGWQPDGTEPRTGAEFLKDQETWRWRAYSPTGRYGRKGILGRFQMRASSGGWRNAEMPAGRWMPATWGNLVAVTLHAGGAHIGAQMAANMMRMNPFIAMVSRL